MARKDFDTMYSPQPWDHVSVVARAAGADRDGRVLVVIQLDGGNNGINTVVPFADEGYARHRKTLRLPKDWPAGYG
jgi:uncharacterized protein (DUF1501 family)